MLSAFTSPSVYLLPKGLLLLLLPNYVSITYIKQSDTLFVMVCLLVIHPVHFPVIIIDAAVSQALMCFHTELLDADVFFYSAKTLLYMDQHNVSNIRAGNKEFINIKDFRIRQYKLTVSIIYETWKSLLPRS